MFKAVISERLTSLSKAFRNQAVKKVHPITTGGHCGRDRMVVGFTTTCAISAYHH
jgi:hypothetical protein